MEIIQKEKQIPTSLREVVNPIMNPFQEFILLGCLLLTFKSGIFKKQTMKRQSSRIHQIYSELQNLPVDDLEQIKTRCVYLLSLLRTKKWQSASSVRYEMIFYEIIVNTLRDRGDKQSYPPFDVFRATSKTLYKSFFSLYQWLDSWLCDLYHSENLLRKDRIFHYRLFCRVVSFSILSTKTAPLCLKTMVEIGRKNYLNLLNTAFPGYVRSGLLDQAVKHLFK